MRVWNLSSGDLERTLEGHTDPVNAVAVTPDGQRIISASTDHTVRVWNLSNGTELAQWVTDTAAVLCCASFPRDPAALVYGDAKGRVVVLSLRQPQSVAGSSTVGNGAVTSPNR